MDQDQNNDLFDSGNPPPQQPESGEPAQMGGGARIYQTPSAGEPAYSPPPAYAPPAAPPKRNNTVLIVVIVVLVLLCCCCLAATVWAAWTYGDTWMQEFSMPLRPMLSLLV
jgi:hypothetical protein